MATIGLLGNEYDYVSRTLKRRIEDFGHRARVCNLTHFPLVTLASVDAERMVLDHHDLAEVDAFYLADMNVREPFFHVRYEREIWEMLRGRYENYVAGETNSIAFVTDLLFLLAHQRPMVNSPQVSSYRNQVPSLLHILRHHDIPVAPYFAGVADQAGENGYDTAAPISDDMWKHHDVLTFPRSMDPDVKLWRRKTRGPIFHLFVLGNHILHDALIQDNDETRRKLSESEVPSAMADTALKAADVIGLRFGEITIQSNTNGEPLVLKVEPSPRLMSLEEEHGLMVSAPLAEYLIQLAGGNTQ